MTPNGRNPANPTDLSHMTGARGVWWYVRMDTAPDSANCQNAENANACELRAAIAREQIPLYVIAAAARVHPRRLGAMLRGRIPIPEEIALRILAALREGPSRVAR